MNNKLNEFNSLNGFIASMCTVVTLASDIKDSLIQSKHNSKNDFSNPVQNPKTDCCDCQDILSNTSFMYMTLTPTIDFYK